jgi:hypothetical protein
MTNIPIKKYRVRRARKHGIDDRALAVQAFITRGNLEELITSNGLPREIDFLSLDVDGNDYWLWETLECVSPRVAVGARVPGASQGLLPDRLRLDGHQCLLFEERYQYRGIAAPDAW